MAAAPPAAEPPATRGYPSLRTVPPRPRLSYPVEQRREIVEGLISDRENARYTDQEVRYRTGRSDVPPPAVRPDPLVGAAAEIDMLVGPAAPLVPEGVLPMDDEEEFATVRRRSGLGGDDLDDDSLGDFIREMVRETRPGGRDEVDLEPLPPPARAAGPQPQPDVVEPEREEAPQASQGGFRNWLGGLLSGRAAASEEGEAVPEVEAEQDEVPASPAAQEAEGDLGSEPAADPSVATSPPAVQPAPSPRKPAIVERPPEPSPVKPEPGPSGSRPEEVRVPS